MRWFSENKPPHTHTHTHTHTQTIMKKSNLFSLDFFCSNSTTRVHIADLTFKSQTRSIHWQQPITIFYFTIFRFLYSIALFFANVNICCWKCAINFFFSFFDRYFISKTFNSDWCQCQWEVKQHVICMYRSKNSFANYPLRMDENNELRLH